MIIPYIILWNYMLSGNSKKRLGAFGEQCAIDYLKRNEYQIICRNFHAGVGEIDIIALSPCKTLVFVEVKTRKRAKNQVPEQSISYKKFNKMWKSIFVYLSKEKDLSFWGGFRIDSIAIMVNHLERIYSLRHVKGICQYNKG